MEYLSFNSLGQWSLNKALTDLQPAEDTKDEYNYNSYRPSNLQGHLPEDNGGRGWLHNSSNTRAPKKNSKHKMSGKVPLPGPSHEDDIHPGIGQ